jgi:hypothetical protein
LAIDGQANPSSDLLEEGDPELAFEVMDLAPDGRLGDRQGRSGGNVGPVAGDRREVAQLP